MNRLKKMVALTLAVLLVAFLLAACGSGSSQNQSGASGSSSSPQALQPQQTSQPSDGQSASTGDKKIVIGFSQGWSGITWLRIMREDILAAAKELGVEVQVSDGDNKAEKQLADIEDFISKKVDALIISTYQAQAIAPGAQKALDAGIPVIVISSDIPGITPTVHLTSDAKETGRMAGEYIAQVLGGKGNIIQLTGREGSVVNRDRGLGFEEILAKYPDMKRVAQQTANYERNEAIQVMEDLLQVHKDIQAVYAHNDEMAMGASMVLRKHGYTIYPKDPNGVVVVGVDALEEPILKAIKDGDLSASLRYITFGREAVQAAVDIINGKEVPQKIILPTPLVTQENVDEYLTGSGG
ncbi:MAG: hypothetical protein BAA01_09800 [Bacillus thermozeamaize]|uniref:Periplasmic binding protein domain-containing protein n=1 Tax=Bacillus thermozeamaize TaxID=230954 RepID=A0A1Y3PKU6_9BACI|nr:MAG: hypothetical protein BAA01_09800 [Bacillus thermozeamaize]